VELDIFVLKPELKTLFQLLLSIFDNETNIPITFVSVRIVNNIYVTEK